MVADREVHWFEDYRPGTSLECGEFSVDETDIIAYAKRYDPQPFHVDPVAAQDGPFSGLIASGWQTVALTMRLLVENFLSPESSLGSPGVEELRWPAPVRPGDRLRIQVTVLTARESRSRPELGIVRSRIDVTSQLDELVLQMTVTSFLRRRPSGEAPGGSWQSPDNHGG